VLVAKYEGGNTPSFKQHRKASGRHYWKVLVWYRWEDGSTSEDLIKPSKCYWNDLLPLILKEMEETVNERPEVKAISFGFNISI
jgi:hypothetical protein